MWNKFYPSIHPLLSTSSVIKSRSRRTSSTIKSRSWHTRNLDFFSRSRRNKIGIIRNEACTLPAGKQCIADERFSFSLSLVSCRNCELRAHAVSKCRIAVLLGERSLAIVKQPTDLLKKCRTPDIQSQQHMDGTTSTLTKAERCQERSERGGSFMVDGQTIHCPRCRAIKAHRQGPMQPDGSLSARLQCEFPSIVYANARAATS